MLTFYHSPQSRSTRVLTLIEAMNLHDWVEVREVTITHFDGSGRPGQVSQGGLRRTRAHRLGAPRHLTRPGGDRRPATGAR